MKTGKGIFKLSYLSALSLLLFSNSANAFLGLYVLGGGAISESLGGTGVAYPEDSLTVEANPAGLAFINHEVDLNLDIINPDGQGHRLGYSATQGVGPFQVAPGRVNSRSYFIVLPSFGYSQPFNFHNQSFAFGVAFYASGLNSDYGAHTPGSTIGTGSGVFGDGHTYADFREYFLPITLAWKASPCFALGLSLVPVIHEFEATGLSNFAGLSIDPAFVSNNGVQYTYGVGVRIGGIYKPTKYISIGGGFLPKIKMGRNTLYAGLLPNRGTLDVPSQATVGISIAPNASIHLNADVQRIWYSDVPALSNNNNCVLGGPPCLGTSNGAGFGWNNIFVYKFGAEWKSSNLWAWRLGFAHSQKLIPNSQVLLNILSPLTSRNYYTAGFTRSLGKAFDFHATAVYAPKVKVSGTNPFNPSQTITDFVELVQLAGELTWKIDA